MKILPICAKAQYGVYEYGWVDRILVAIGDSALRAASRRAHKAMDKCERPKVGADGS